MPRNETIDSTPRLVKRAAGEDLKKGDFVTKLSEVQELPSFLWSCCSSEQLPANEPIRIQLIASDSGIPHKVQNVCLPFVYATCPQGSLKTFDVRQHNLAKFPSKDGQRVWKMLSLQSTS